MDEAIATIELLGATIKLELELESESESDPGREVVQSRFSREVDLTWKSSSSNTGLPEPVMVTAAEIMPHPEPIV
jgi:hypothetical protein